MKTWVRVTGMGAATKEGKRKSPALDGHLAVVAEETVFRGHLRF